MEEIERQMQEIYIAQGSINSDLSVEIRERLDGAERAIADVAISEMFMKRYWELDREFLPEHGFSYLSGENFFLILLKQLSIIEEMEKISGETQESKVNQLMDDFQRTKERMSALHKVHNDMLLTGRSGRTLRPYPEEIELNRCMTPSMYVAELAEALRGSSVNQTMKNLEYWRRYNFQYEPDSADIEYYERHKLDNGKHDFLQTYDMTLQRVKDGKYCGDCEDLMELNLHILEAMNIPAVGMFVIASPTSSHMTTLVFEKDSHRRYTAHELSTCGYCKNGLILGGRIRNQHHTTAFDSPSDQRTNEKGYRTFLDAIASVLFYYHAGHTNPQRDRYINRSFKIYEQPDVSYNNGKMHITRKQTVMMLSELEKHITTLIDGRY